MNTDLLFHAAQLSDGELLAKVELLAKQERETVATLIAYLAVLDERHLYLAEGCSSLFTYCMQALRVSEAAAYDRMEVARAVRKYPLILEMLANGSLTLTTARLLAPALTPANHRRLLDSAAYKTKQDVLKLVAWRRPLADVPASIRQLPSRTATLVLAPPPPAEVANDQAPPAAEPVLEVRPPARPVMVPLSPKRFKIQFTATEETHDLLRRAQDLLRHQIPNSDVGEVMAKALKVLVRELEKEKIAATDRPRGSRGTNPRSRHIPAEVKRQVWKRDGGLCAFVAHNGRRCTERGFLEFHHVEPYSAGGKATVDNIELRCRAHNGYEAELRFGSIRAGPS
jgi:5-methylcytosine-specific restriction endonuclease McrA